MTTEEAEAALKEAGADVVLISERPDDRASIRVEAGGRKMGISAELPHGLAKAVSRLTQWLQEGV